jgi:hypothetical protein
LSLCAALNASTIFCQVSPSEASSQLQWLRTIVGAACTVDIGVTKIDASKPAINTFNVDFLDFLIFISSPQVDKIKIEFVSTSDLVAVFERVNF